MADDPHAVETIWAQLWFCESDWPVGRELFAALTEEEVVRERRLQKRRRAGD
jgi:hypothetical protein